MFDDPTAVATLIIASTASHTDPPLAPGRCFDTVYGVKCPPTARPAPGLLSGRRCDNVTATVSAPPEDD
jgi:hypothetical protein